MSAHILDTAIEFLKGVGPQRADLLRFELSIFTFKDLLQHYPFRYTDRSKFYKIKEINSESIHVQLIGKIRKIESIGKGPGKRMVAHFADETGMMELVWFKGIRWVRPLLKEGAAYMIYGKPSSFKGKINIVHPEINPLNAEMEKPEGGLQPVYSSTEKLSARGLNSRGIEKVQKNLLAQINGHIAENLPAYMIEKFRFLGKQRAVLDVHFPSDAETLKKAEWRLKFEELFFIQLQLLKLKKGRQTKWKGFVFGQVGSFFNSFYHDKLPFELTNAQKRVIREIRKDLGSGQQMNRLLQGDVGSGKTIVALMIMLLALDNGFQSSIMAPTEILANQHFESVSELLQGLDVKVGLLTGSTKASDRKELFSGLKNGEIHMLIGTHALLEEKVQFNNLGMVVIDEQHRFGVAQRARLWKKNTQPPHVLVMTATPIPRTLAMTFYGDLDTSVIDEMPPGRKPIKTIHRFDSSRLRVFGFMKEQIKAGRQIYVVYPLIKESETMDYKDLVDGYESISRAFPLPEYKVGIVHGQMKSVDKDLEMQRFAKGECHILVATTVIEVGVNVPNASVMVVESAERFGLSQLHQLRGRVGRGAEQSYCILMTGNKLTHDARLRMDTMVKTNDGFVIAETDLKIRGPGDLMGTRQSGILDLKIANLVSDGQVLQAARNAAMEILNHDPGLEKPENALIAQELKRIQRENPNWSRIS